MEEKEKEEQKLPLVSVVVPNYNYARYLVQRIESILNQTFKDFELILLDDASTDDSVAVLETYRDDPHVSHIVVNDVNTGNPFKQWMKGVLLARGKYVWIAEADDCAEHNFLETCVSLMEKHEEAVVCNVGSLLMDAEGNISKKDINHWGRRAKNGYACFHGKKYAECNLYWKNYLVNASGILFSRECAVRLADSVFLSMRYCGDWMFWFEMAMMGDVIEVYKNLNYFRQHASKVTVASHKAGAGILEDIEVLSRMEKFLPCLSEYKRRLRRGLLYRKLLRHSLSLKDKTDLKETMFAVLQATEKDYRLERWNQLLRWVMPSLLTRKRDRL